MALAYEKDGNQEKAAEIYEELAVKNSSPEPAPVSEAEKPVDQPYKKRELTCACGELLRPHWKICPACGKELNLVCSCGEPLKEGWKICPNCEKKTGS